MLEDKFLKAIRLAKEAYDQAHHDFQRRCMIVAAMALQEGHAVTWTTYGLRDDARYIPLKFVDPKSGEWRGEIDFDACGCIRWSGDVPDGYRLEGYCENHGTLVGVREAAEILGWNPAKVSTYYRRGKMPKPVEVLASGPVWTRKQIEDYAKQ